MIPVGRRRWAFLPLLALTFVLGGVLVYVDGPLQTAAAPRGILSYEVAGSVEVARRMLDSWAGQATAYAGFSLGIDYLYMPAYSTTLALGCLWAAGVLGGVSVRLASLGVALAWGQWLAALLDAKENVALTLMLFGGAREPWPWIAWWCAVPKFVLISAGMLYALAAVAVRAVRR